MPTPEVTADGGRAWAVPLCWTAVLLDGFDLVVLGTVLPVLPRDKVWGLDPGTATVLSTIGLVGMTIGARPSARSPT